MAKNPIKLTLDDVLPRGPGSPNLDLEASSTKASERAVVGLIKKGEMYVRLEQLLYAGFSSGGSQRTSESFKALFCVRGSHLIADLSSNRYCTEIRISLFGFEEWLQLPSLKFEESESEFTVHIPKWPEKMFELNETIITVGAKVNSKSDGAKGKTIQQEGYLTYTPKLPMTLDEVRNTVRKIEDLLVLLTDCEETLGLPQVKIKGNDTLNQVSYETQPQRGKRIARSDLWTTFSNLSPNFGEIAEAWFAKSTKFGPGFHLYLGNRRGMQLYVENRFANLVWGLEALHRSKTPVSSPNNS